MGYSLRLLAFSDLHGRAFGEAAELIDALSPDWIVLCGDMLPDYARVCSRGNRLMAQEGFWEIYRSIFVREGVVTTYVRGNHEIEGFLDPLLVDVPQILRGHVVRLEGIPIDNGAFGWSREWSEEELLDELEIQLQQAPRPQIYISHVPPYGCQDQTRYGQHIGHRELERHLRAREWPEALVLCGHVHEAFGVSEKGETQIVNLAGGFAHIEWRLGSASVLGMKRLPGGNE